MQIQNVSEKLLEEFLAFCNSNNSKPIIVGGWAVFAFTQKEKSVDIDLILPKQKDLKKTESFFETNGFIKTVSKSKEVCFEKTFFDDKNKRIELFFEIFDLNEKNVFKENHLLELPWSLSKKFNIELLHGKQKMLVPQIELLLLYKTKAFRDRTFKFFSQKSFLQQKSKARLLEKLEKDKRDILSLLEAGKLNQSKLENLLKATPSKRLLKETLDEIIKKYGLLG